METCAKTRDEQICQHSENGYKYDMQVEPAYEYRYLCRRIYYSEAINNFTTNQTAVEHKNSVETERSSTSIRTDGQLAWSNGRSMWGQLERDSWAVAMIDITCRYIIKR